MGNTLNSFEELLEGVVNEVDDGLGLGGLGGGGVGLLLSGWTRGGLRPTKGSSKEETNNSGDGLGLSRMGRSEGDKDAAWDGKVWDD